MNINKDNYEEYFLLFADNELTAQEKNMVEAFIGQHPELEDDFINIKQSVLKPETELKLENKDPLFRRTKHFISFNNYQEAFTLYHDNELTSPERRETEAFLLENPSLLNEFKLFQKAKLQPEDTIACPDKESLFKKDTVKIVPFKWWRAVAAAAILGMGIWIGANFYSTKTTVHLTVKNIPEKPARIKLTPVDTINSQQGVTALKSPEKHSSKQRLHLQQNTIKLPEKKNEANDQALKAEKPANNLSRADNVAGKIQNKKSGNPIPPVQNGDKSTVVKADDDAQIKDGKNLTANMDNKEAKPGGIANTEENTVPDAVKTSYKEDENDNSNNSNNYAFFDIPQEKFDKSKVGGFLRKVKRIIERKISPLTTKNQREVAVN